MRTRGRPRRSAALVAATVFLSVLAGLPPLALASLPADGSRPQAATPSAAAPPLSLEALLAKAAEYCRRLESSAFDFVCREEITESIDPRLDAENRETPGTRDGWTGYKGPTITLTRYRKLKRSFVYDYQCVRAGRVIRETRTQLEENGKRKVVPNAELETSVVVFGNSLLSPVGLFGERFQPDYVFTAAGEEARGKTRTVVVDASPAPGAPATRNLYGKAWFDAATGDILEIEWSESRVGRFDVFKKRGDLYGRTPRLVIRSEFRAEKNGIRFPSRMTVEEAYLAKGGRAVVRSRTVVVYKDFKFFTVEYEARD